MSGPRARDEILRRIGAALADRPAPGPVPRDYRTAGTGSGGDVVALFAERAADYKADVRRVAPQELPGAVAEALRGRGARRLAVPPGLPAAWLAEAGVEAHGDDPPLGVRELDALDGVVSGCAVAIAGTGTIVLDGGAAQGRRALTLLPDYHLCVDRKSVV
jgi:L-lactate dehydrogenase complex protein LldG